MVSDDTIQITLSGGSPWGFRLSGGGPQSLTINKIRKKSPADEQGLGEGDVLIAINGVPVTGKSQVEALEMIEEAKDILVLQVIRSSLRRDCSNDTPAEVEQIKTAVVTEFEESCRDTQKDVEAEPSESNHVQETAHTDEIELRVTANEIEVSVTANETEVSVTANETEATTTTNETEVNATANETEVSTTVNETEVSVTANKTEVTTTTNETEVSATANETEVSGTTSETEVSATANETEISATANETEVSATANETEVSTTANETEVSAAGIESEDSKIAAIETEVSEPNQVIIIASEIEISAQTNETDISAIAKEGEISATVSATEVIATVDETEVRTTVDEAKATESNEVIIIANETEFSSLTNEAGVSELANEEVTIIANETEFSAPTNDTNVSAIANNGEVNEAANETVVETCDVSTNDGNVTDENEILLRGVDVVVPDSAPTSTSTDDNLACTASTNDTSDALESDVSKMVTSDVSEAIMLDVSDEVLPDVSDSLSPRIIVTASIDESAASLSAPIPDGPLLSPDIGEHELNFVHAPATEPCLNFHSRSPSPNRLSPTIPVRESSPPPHSFIQPHFEPINTFTTKVPYSPTQPSPATSPKITKPSLRTTPTKFECGQPNEIFSIEAPRSPLYRSPVASPIDITKSTVRASPTEATKRPLHPSPIGFGKIIYKTSSIFDKSSPLKEMQDVQFSTISTPQWQSPTFSTTFPSITKVSAFNTVLPNSTMKSPATSPFTVAQARNDVANSRGLPTFSSSTSVNVEQVWMGTPNTTTNRSSSCQSPNTRAPSFRPTKFVPGSSRKAPGPSTSFFQSESPNDLEAPPQPLFQVKNVIPSSGQEVWRPNMWRSAQQTSYPSDKPFRNRVPSHFPSVVSGQGHPLANLRNQEIPATFSSECVGICKMDPEDFRDFYRNKHPHVFAPPVEIHGESGDHQAAHYAYYHFDEYDPSIDSQAMRERSRSSAAATSLKLNQSPTLLRGPNFNRTARGWGGGGGDSTTIGPIMHMSPPSQSYPPVPPKPAPRHQSSTNKIKAGQVSASFSASSARDWKRDQWDGKRQQTWQPMKQQEYNGSSRSENVYAGYTSSDPSMSRAKSWHSGSYNYPKESDEIHHSYTFVESKNWVEEYTSPAYRQPIIPGTDL